jgi:hypothetical protein
MKWRFNHYLRTEVQVGITQRDGFDNDSVSLAETIIREPVQNSLDASLKNWANKHSKRINKADEQVTVVYRWVDVSDKAFFKALLQDQIPHAEAAGLDTKTIDFNKPRALVIEDFGTTGLLGDVKENDEKDFHGLWKKHGISHKTGKALGRWGLGKLVYSLTSEIGVYFGLTLRPGDRRRYLMGQTVLNGRKFDGKDYPPHALCSSIEGEGTADPVSVPCDDDAVLEQFCQNFSIDRTRKTGLSIVIPFPNSDFKTDTMISFAITNYYYAIASGKLVLQVEDTVINASNVRQLAKKYASNKLKDIDYLFDFVEGTLQVTKSKGYTKMPAKWLNDSKLTADDFLKKTLEEIQSKFVAGELISLWLPVTISPKVGPSIETGFAVFLKKPQGLLSGQDLYVRGGLLLSKESKFGHRLALGAMVADEEPISELLGYAENEAHTKWNIITQKLTEHYKDSDKTVRAIKSSVVQLFDLIAGTEEQRDEDGSKDFFSFKKPTGLVEKKKRKKKKKRTDPTKIIVKSKRPLTYISPTIGGFKLSGTDALADKTLPRVMTVEVAYDVIKGNAFKKFELFDFDLQKSDIALTHQGIDELKKFPNKLTFNVTSLKFNLNLEGFDVNRDLKIKVQ